jgi:hypothetical protein
MTMTDRAVPAAGALQDPSNSTQVGVGEDRATPRAGAMTQEAP